MSDELDTKKRILESSIHLFGTKGFERTTTRDIATHANVNLASINYHFRTKQNLLKEVGIHITDEFKKTIQNIKLDHSLSAADYAVKVYEAMIEDRERFISHFKLFLGMDETDCMTENYPMGYEDFSFYMRKELPPEVTEAELLWAMSVTFGYLIHMAIMSCTPTGRQKIDKFFPDKEQTIPSYIRHLVAAAVGDLRSKYQKND